MILDSSISSITNLIGKFTTEPFYFKGFSASVLPGTVGMPGFNLKQNTDNFYMIDWSLAIKMANSLNEDIVIENIKSEWRGINGFVCKSDDFCNSIYRVKSDGDVDAIEKLLAGNKQKVLLPFLMKKQSEIIIQANFALYIYKKRFLRHLDMVHFKKIEVKEPDTYHQLYRKSLVKIRLNGKWRSLVLKPQEFFVAGDILNIPDTN